MAENEVVIADDENEPVLVELDDDDGHESKEKHHDSSMKKSEHEDDEEGEDDDDEDLSPTDAKRKSRAEERKRKREKARADKEADRREIAELKRQNADIQRRMANVDQRTVSQDLSQIDAAMTQASQAAQAAERKIADGVATGNGAATVEGQREWYQAAKAHEQLSEIKKRAQQAPQPQQGVDPVLRAHYDAWQARNPWYDVNRKDPDSAVTFAVDNALAAEGWNPREPGYWDELDKRLKKYVPHRYENAAQGEQDESAPRPRAPTGATAKNTATKPGVISLPAEYVKSLKEAGLWDDVETRKRMAKRFRDNLKKES